jgi:hypothetical protein
LFLEDTLKLVENPPQDTETIYFGAVPTDPLFRINNSFPDKFHFQRKIKAHGKSWYLAYEKYLKNLEIANFIRGYLGGDILFEPLFDNFDLIVKPLGRVRYMCANLFRDKLIFWGKGDLNINPQENLEKLASYYRLVK